MTQKNCNYCGRKGLLIYPVRYAVACAAGANGVPELTDDFKIFDAPQNIANAKFSLRALRPGYLYTYDQKRRLLKGYIVTPRGHLWNFPLEFPAPDASLTVMNCFDPVDIALSLCVDVAHSDADPAENFWIGWSSCYWTPALVQRAHDASWRLKHMQCINIAGMEAGCAWHTGEFKKSYKNVSHFCTELRAMQKAFGFSNTGITHEARHRRILPEILRIIEKNSTNQKGYIVAVNDPVGVTNDLSELTVPTAHAGFNEEMYRAKIIDDLITQTEESVRAYAKSEFTRKHPALPYEQSIPQRSKFRSFGERISEMTTGNTQSKFSYEEEQRKFEKVRDENEQLASDAAWRELTTSDTGPILDDARRAALPRIFEKELRNFEPMAVKLAVAHNAWLTSPQLANWMEGVHDPSNLASGFAYRESLAQCIGKAIGTPACEAQLVAWLNSPSTTDTRNLYMRALFFNHNEIANAAQIALGKSDIKFENLFSIYQGALERLQKSQAAKLIDHLVLATANILIRSLTSSTKASGKNATLISLSLLGRTSIRASNISARDLRNWAVEQAQAQGLIQSSDRKSFKAEALKQAKKIVPSNFSDGRICAYEMDMEKLRLDGRIAPGSLKAIRIPGFDLTKKWLGSSSEFNIGIVANLLQTAALYFAISEYSGSDNIDSNNAAYAAVIASVSLISGLVETISTAVSKVPTHPLSAYLYEHWAIQTSVGVRLIPATKMVALIAGILAAALDVYSGVLAWNKGERKLATAYWTSGAINLILAYAAWSVGAVFFWPAFIVAMIMAIVLAKYKQTMLKKWLSRCYFAYGRSSSSTQGYYASLDEELRAFNSAVGGS